MIVKYYKTNLLFKSVGDLLYYRSVIDQKWIRAFWPVPNIHCFVITEEEAFLEMI